MLTLILSAALMIPPVSAHMWQAPPSPKKAVIIYSNEIAPLPPPQPRDETMFQ